ncbi:MAG: T9SS type A sorting domain-containing protein [Sphingobacteriaceae bacterium]|nr:T9SS type A sorting domain-containing protein [Sphingobacteriaceae bacterium]
MKNFLLILAINFICLSINAQTEMNSVWMKGFGDSGNEHIMASTIDASGNIYVTGRIQYSLDIDPGPSTVTVDVNNRQCFFSKFSPTGNLLWSRNFDGESVAESDGVGIAVDASGDVYVTGYFRDGPIDFNLASPGTNTIAPQDKDMYIVKYSSAGAFVWVKAIGTLSANITPRFVKVDGAGDVVIVGSFNNEAPTTVDFNPAGPSYTLASNSGPDDAFMAKYNSSGVLQWAFNVGSPLGEMFLGIDIDASNNIYAVGTIQSTADIDPSTTGTYTVASEGTAEAILIAKYTSAGAFVWGHATGGSIGDGAIRVKLDNNGDLLVSGYMTSTSFDADPGTATVTLTKVGIGPTDAFIGKYNSTNGNLIWAKNTGGSANVEPYAMTLDAQNNIYLGGGFSGTMDMDLTASVNTFTAITIGGMDVYLAKYDPSGNFVVAYNFGGGSGPGGGANFMQIASNNDIILSGYYSTVADFDPSAAANTLPYVGGSDAFVNRYSQCVSPDTPTLGATSLTMCANGVATLSVVAGNLNSATNWVWTSVACGSSTMSVGATATVSPPFLTSYFVRGEGGCPTPTGACASASVSVDPLKGITGTVTTGAAIPVPGFIQLFRYEGPLTKWDSVTYQNVNASGIYSFNAVNSGSYIIMSIPTATDMVKTYAPNNATWKNSTVFYHGCLIDYNININVVPMLTLTPGPGVLSGKIIEGQGYGNKGNVTPGNPIGGISIKGGKNPGGGIMGQARTDATGGYTFTSLPLSGIGESYFIFVDIPGIDTNGTHHSAIVTGTTMYTDLDFVVDSDYVNPIDYTGIRELKLDGERITVYPNPATDLVYIKMDAKGESNISLELYDMLGKKVLTQNYEAVQSEFKASINVATLNRGVYFVKVRLNSGEAMIKFVLSE